MKKVVRLTESDLVRIVKRTILSERMVQGNSQTTVVQMANSLGIKQGNGNLSYTYDETQICFKNEEGIELCIKF